MQLFINYIDTSFYVVLLRPSKSQTDTTLRVFCAIPAVVARRKRLHFFFLEGGEGVELEGGVN